MENIYNFSTISLEEMKGVKLLNRIDTKFVTHIDNLSRLLKLVSNEYSILEIDGKREIKYCTSYYDTGSYDMYRQHQRCHVNRQKLRFRTYVDTGLEYLEVKTKDNHGRTIKNRIQARNGIFSGSNIETFLNNNSKYSTSELMHTLDTFFSRITLVNQNKTERVTIDTGLTFLNQKTGIKKQWDDIAIIELKRSRIEKSVMIDTMRLLRIHPHMFSKYCIGITITTPDIFGGRFKNELAEIYRIIKR